MDSLINSSLGGEVDFWDFAAEDAPIAGLDVQCKGVEMVGLSFEPKADGGDKNLADETGASVAVGGSVWKGSGRGIGHRAIDFGMVRKFFTLKDRLWRYRRDGPIEGVAARG